MVSGNFPTQLSLITTCHSPGTGAFSLAQRTQETGWGSWAHRVTQTWGPASFGQLMGTTGTEKPLLWPHTWPQTAQCHRCIALGGMDCPSAGDGKQFSLHMPTVGSGYQEFCADHFEILSRFGRKNIKVDC